MTPAGEREYRDRIAAYMHKAMREAKVFTSWLNPSERHERAMARFIDTALAPDHRAFRDELLPFCRRVARYGIYNSLAQLALKIGAPGVPDFYQGTETWTFTLVDPDNRRPVDYARRRALLEALDAALAAEGAGTLVDRLMADPADDGLKLYVTSALLRSGGRTWQSSSAAGTIPSGWKVRTATTCSRSRATTGVGACWSSSPAWSPRSCRMPTCCRSASVRGATRGLRCRPAARRATGTCSRATWSTHGPTAAPRWTPPKCSRACPWPSSRVDR